MSSDSFLIIIFATILLSLVDIILSIILLKSSEFNSGFILIIFGLVINSIIQISDFLSGNFSELGTIYLTPFTIISFFGSAVLFFILIAFLLTQKYESKILKNESTYHLKYKYDYFKPNHSDSYYNLRGTQITEEQLISKKDFGKRIDEFKPQKKIEKESISTEIKESETEIKTHISEKRTNGKVVVAKFIAKEEPISEAQKIKDELEKIKFQRDKLVSIISHDLRTPLNSVFGYCQLLKDGQYKNSDEVKQFAQNIFELSKQQLDALNEIIKWTKYESSELRLNPTEFDVTSTINFVVKSMSKIAETKSIKILVNSKPDLFVYSDEFMIIEVLKNLLENAIKFSHPGGSIEIHTHYHKKINKLVVLVVDSGIGIDKDILMNLLISSKKITTRGTKGEKGLGLGLLIVKAIIDKHGEHFWIASEEGKWTRVYFTLKPSKTPEET